MQLSTLVYLALAVATPAAAQNFALVGFGAGTTGGGSAASTTVTSCSALSSAASASGARVITLTSVLSGCGTIDVASDKTIRGSGTAGGIRGTTLRIRDVSNVIIRNLDLGTPGSAADVVSLDGATRVWIDHNNFHSNGLTGGKDDYDGLLDITHASDLVTVSWNKFSDHWKGSLVGHSDSNESEDTGHLRVTYHHNIWNNVNSRTPSLRFGSGHVYSSIFTNIPTSGINSRMGAQVLVEQNIFTNVKLAVVTNLDSDTDGFINQRNNIFNGTTTTQVTQTSSWTPGYSYTADSTSNLSTLLNSYAGIGKV